MKWFSHLKAQIRSHWRKRYREELARRGEQPSPDFSDERAGDGDLHPPDAERVARRACCLSAVALRGLASTWEHADQQEFLPRLRDWFSKVGLENEIEPAEQEILAAPASELDDRSAVNACWRWEGAAVLAASLGRLTLPAYDETVDTQACGEACALLAPTAETHEFIHRAEFAPSFDRLAYANQALSVHWRLRQFIHVKQEPIDFPTFAHGVQWAQFDLTGFRLVDRDLAIGRHAIAEADPEHVRTAMSIASERHIAANWLIGWTPIYSEVENPT